MMICKDMGTMHVGYVWIFNTGYDIGRHWIGGLCTFIFIWVLCLATRPFESPGRPPLNLAWKLLRNMWFCRLYSLEWRMICANHSVYPWCLCVLFAFFWYLGLLWWQFGRNATLLRNKFSGSPCIALAGPCVPISLELGAVLLSLPHGDYRHEPLCLAV